MADANGFGTADGEILPGRDSGQPPPLASYLRLAQLAPELGAVDLCYRTKGSQGFTGPLLVSAAPSLDAGAGDGGPSDAGAGDGGPSDAGSSGLPFGTVSTWVPLSVTGTLDLALVPAGDANCSAPRVVGQVTLDAGKRVTLVAMGTAMGADAGIRGLGIESFVDDAVAHAETVRVRVVHGALGGASSPGWGALAMSVAFGAQVEPIAAVVAPRHASSPTNVPPVVDALGYHERAPVTQAASLRFAYASDAGSNGGPWSTPPVGDLGLAPTTVVTVFLLDLDADLGALVCDDLPPSGAPSCRLLRAK